MAKCWECSSFTVSYLRTSIGYLGFFYAKIYFGETFLLLLMSTFTHRDRLTILAEILKTINESKKGKSKTNIMQSANLNYHQANKYLRLLLINRLLYLNSEDRYKPTKKGLELIRTLESQNLTLK